MLRGIFLYAAGIVGAVIGAGIVQSLTRRGVVIPSALLPVFALVGFAAVMWYLFGGNKKEGGQ